MKNLIIASLVVGAAATPALAQEADPTFTGPRVEGLVGYDSLGIDGIEDPDGVTYGVGVGFDFAAAGLLVGIEGEASDSTAKIKLAGPDVKAGRDLYVGARLGTIVGGKALLYVKGGYTNARIKYAGFSEDGDGWRAGAGVEYALSSNSFVKAEYRYSDYEGDVTRNQAVGGFGFRF